MTCRLARAPGSMWLTLAGPSETAILWKAVYYHLGPAVTHAISGILFDYLSRVDFLASVFLKVASRTSHDADTEALVCFLGH